MERLRNFLLKNSLERRWRPDEENLLRRAGIENLVSKLMRLKYQFESKSREVSEAKNKPESQRSRSSDLAQSDMAEIRPVIKATHARIIRSIEQLNPISVLNLEGIEPKPEVAQLAADKILEILQEEEKRVGAELEEYLGYSFSSGFVDHGYHTKLELKLEEIEIKRLVVKVALKRLLGRPD